MLFTKIVFYVYDFDIHNSICTQHVLNFYFSCNSMNNLSSYCGLTDSRMRASDPDLPVPPSHGYRSLANKSVANHQQILKIELIFTMLGF